MLRLFVAVDLPASLKDEVARLMSAELHQVRWVRPPQLHITLRFLGNTPDDGLPDVEQRLASVAVPGFLLRLQGAGVFPDRPERRRLIPPKVLWLGIEPAQEVIGLEQAVESALSGEATPARACSGPREYSPHLTLARFTGPPDHTLSHFLARHQFYTSAPWRANSFHLYQSVLGREGAIHTCLGSYALARHLW
jgi:2'-5' RNA ligase